VVKSWLRGKSHENDSIYRVVIMDCNKKKVLDRSIRLPGSELKGEKESEVTIIQAKKEVLTLISTYCKKLVGWNIASSLVALNIHSRRYPSGMEIVELN